jgi:hypothetical protein
MLRAKPSQAKPSQAKPSQAKPSQASAAAAAERGVLYGVLAPLCDSTLWRARHAHDYKLPLPPGPGRSGRCAHDRPQARDVLGRAALAERHVREVDGGKCGTQREPFGQRPHDRRGLKAHGTRSGVGENEHHVRIACGRVPPARSVCRCEHSPGRVPPDQYAAVSTVRLPPATICLLRCGCRGATRTRTCGGRAADRAAAAPACHRVRRAQTARPSTVRSVVCMLRAKWCLPYVVRGSG